MTVDYKKFFEELALKTNIEGLPYSFGSCKKCEEKKDCIIREEAKGQLRNLLGCRGYSYMTDCGMEYDSDPVWRKE